MYKRQDESLLETQKISEPDNKVQEIELQTLIEENKALKAELSERRIQQQDTYVARPLDLSEFKTRCV